MTEITVIASKRFFKSGDRYMTTGGFGKVIEAIAMFFDKIKLVVPVKIDDTFEGYKIKSDNIEYVDLPYYENELQFTMLSPLIFLKVYKAVKESELVHGWISGYETWFAYMAAKKYNKRMMVYAGTDWEWISHYWKFKSIKWLTKLYAKANNKIVTDIANTYPTFFMGEQFYDKYSNCKYAYKTDNSTLHKEDIYKYRDTCKNKQLKLLTVGRLSSEKSFMTALVATRQLNQEKIPAMLVVVGDGPEKDNLTDEYSVMMGMIPQGPKLTSTYRSADIFVFPSHENSIAKVCLEAMCNGLPVVCTNEGAFPKDISDDKHCILVNRDKPMEIVEAVKKIQSDDKFRQRMIKTNLKDTDRYLIDNIVHGRLKLARFIK